MKKHSAGAAGALALFAAGRRSAHDTLTLQLKWVTQAQFAGYYVAKDKGFYEPRRTSTSTILPGGPNVAPSR